MMRLLFPLPQYQFAPLFPYIALAITGMFGLLLHMLKPHGNSRGLFFCTFVGVVAALISQLSLFGNQYELFDMVTKDNAGMIAETLILVSLMVVLLISNPYFKSNRIHCPEFFPLICWASLGGMLMCVTTNLLVVFVGLELLSISLYVLAGLNKRSKFSQESAMKYFLLGAFATGFFLYGIAFLYGASGSLNFESFARFAASANADNRPLMVISFILLVVGFSFKAGMAPFNQWIPDVYSGAPTNVVAFMASGAKIGPFMAFFHLISNTVGLKPFAFPVLVVLAVLSMFIGNIMAFNQTETKKLLAYSSVANAGYIAALLAGMVTDRNTGFWTLTYFLVGYVFATMGVFIVLGLVGKDEDKPQTLESLRGLSKQNPVLAACLVVFVLSQIGIGPVAGFLGKVFIISDLISLKLTWLAVLLVVNSAFGAFYYFKLVRSAYTDNEHDTPKLAVSGDVCFALGICVTGVIGTVIFYSPLVSFFVGNR